MLDLRHVRIWQTPASSDDAPSAHGAALQFVCKLFPDVSCGRQREVFPRPSSQGFLQFSINFHFGKTHTHTHTRTRAHRHRRSSSSPPTVTRERQPDRKKERTSEAHRWSVFLKKKQTLLLETSGNELKETKQCGKSRIAGAWLFFFLNRLPFYIVPAPSGPCATPQEHLEWKKLIRLVGTVVKTPPKEWSNRYGAGQCPVLHTEDCWSRGVSR